MPSIFTSRFPELGSICVFFVACQENAAYRLGCYQVAIHSFTGRSTRTVALVSFTRGYGRPDGRRIFALDFLLLSTSTIVRYTSCNF